MDHNDRGKQKSRSFMRLDKALLVKTYADVG